MLEVLKGLIQQAGQSAVVQNNEVPNEHNEDVMGEVMQGLLGGLTNQANQQDGVSSLLGFLTGGGNRPVGESNLMNNPIVSSISQSVMGNIMSKFGLSNSAASGVVGSMIPQVLGGLITKINNPNDSSIDIGSMMGVLSGSKTQGIDFSTILSQGNDDMADGKLDISDLAKIKNETSNHTQTSGGGGLMGSILGSLFGKK